MKRSTINKLLLAAGVASALGLAQPVSAQVTNIAFVAGLTGGALDKNFDIFWANRLTAQGYNVIPLDQNTPAGSVPAVELFIISSDVGSGNIRDGNKIGLQQPAPYLVYEYGNFVDFFGGGGAGTAGLTNINIVVSDHPLAAGFSGPVTLNTASSTISTSTGRSANVTVVGVNPANSAQAMLFCLEPGVSNGTTNFPARRIGVPVYDTWATNSITADALAIMDAAVAYALKPPPVVDVDHFDVAASSPQVAGAAFDVTITAKDAANVTTDTGSALVTASSPTSGSLMEFDWNSDGNYGDNSGTLVAGVKTIKARNKKAQTATIVAFLGAATTTTPPSVTTTADVFSKLQVLAPGQTAAPGTTTGLAGAVGLQTMGVPFGVTVNAVDAYWNPVTSADTVAITSTDNTATLPADAALVAGTKSFGVTFNQRGNFTVTATDTSNGSITNGVSSSINSAAALVWLGDGSANLWDTTSANWSNSVNASITTYGNGDVITFNSIGSTTPPVNIVGTNNPLSVTVNSANNYTLGSTTDGKIGGTGTITKSGTGTLTINNANTYTGRTTVSGGLLKLESANALPGGILSTGGTSGLTLDGGVLGLATGDFTRGSGNSANQVRVIGTNSGFAAFGADRVVNLGGTTNTLTYGNADFFPGTPPTNSVFMLGHATATHTVNFQNGLSLGNPGGNRIIRVENGAAEVDAIISGRIDDASASPGNIVKTGTGTLKLTHPTSNYEGTTEVQDGTLILTGGMNNNNIFVLGSGTTSGVFQLGDASINKNLSVGSLTTSGTGTGNMVVGGNASVSVLTLNNFLSDVTFAGVLGGAAAEQNNLALTKNGAATLTLSGVSTYSGPTTINSGILSLTGAGSIGDSATITVGATFDVSAVTGGYVLGTSQTLQGSGSVQGDVTAKGSISPGSGIGTMYFFNNLTLNGTLVMEIENTPSSDNITCFGTVTPGGALVVTNIGGELTLGSTFYLFSTPVSGSFNKIVYPPGYVFTNNLAVDGTIQVVGIAPPAPTPTNITYSVSGGNLILDWPVGQGWQLQSQANPLTVGISTNWVNVPGAVPPFTNAVNSASGAVFYRLVYP